MIKKLIGIILAVFLMLNLSSFTMMAFADDDAVIIAEDGTTTIPAVSYINSGDRNGNAVPIVGDSLSFNIAGWVEYKFTVIKENEYFLIAYAGAVGEVGIDVSLNGEVIENATFKPTDGYLSPLANDITTLNLPAGTYTIRFTNRTGGCHFFSFSLKRKYGNKTFAKEEGSYKDTVLPTKIEAENFDLGESGSKSIFAERRGSAASYRKDSNITINTGTSKLSYNILLYKDEFVRYTFDVGYAGTYRLSVTSKAEGKAEIYFDGYKKPLLINTTGDNIEGETFVEDIYLKEGTYTITLKTCDEVMLFDYIRFASGFKNGIELESLTLDEEVNDKEQQKVSQNTHNIYKKIYVSADGNDKAAGTKEAPFKTLKRAKEEVASCNDEMTGDIVVYICGEYFELTETEDFNVEHSGKNGYNVIIQGENRLSPPIVHGGKQVTGWEKHNDILWRAPAPEGITDVRHLYINGFPAVRAQSKYTYKVNELVDDPETPENPDGFKIYSNNFPEKLSNVEDMECMWSIEWFSFISPVKSVTYGENTVTFMMDQPNFGMNAMGTAKMNVARNSCFYMENVPELLDEPGEFYYNKKDGYIYYYPYKSDDMLNDDIFVGKVEFLLDIKGNSVSDKVENLVFDNLDIRYSVWNYITEYGLKGLQAEALFDVRNSSYNMFLAPSQITVNYANNVKFTNNIFSCLGSTAIAMRDSVTNSIVDGNIFKDTAGGAISIGSFDHNTIESGALICRNIDVTNNVIRRLATEQRNCVPISVYYEADINIKNNDIEDVPYSGISVGWGWGAKPATVWGDFNISNNRIVDIMSSLRDGSHIYTLGGSRESVISGNYTADSGYILSGIYNDQGSRYYEIFDNVVECDEMEHWWMQGIDGTGYLNAYDNHIIDGSVRVAQEANNTEKNTTKYENRTWTGKALEIINNAGVKKEYKNLLTLSERPKGKVSILESIPKELYIPVSERKALEGTVEAEDFMFGGEGVGYHKITPINPPNNTYRPLTDEVSLLMPDLARTYVVDNNFDGEWLQYEVEIKETDEYYFDIVASQKWGENVAQPAVNVYIDGELVIARKPIPYTEDWLTLTNFNMGRFKFTEGKHIIKVEILNNGFYFDAFRIHRDDLSIANKEMSGNDPEYDECRIVYEEG